MNNGTLVNTMVNDALTDAFNHYHMVIILKTWRAVGLAREELDEFATSQRKQSRKLEIRRRFKDEIVPRRELSRRKRLS